MLTNDFPRILKHNNGIIYDGGMYEGKPHGKGRHFFLFSFLFSFLHLERRFFHLICLFAGTMTSPSGIRYDGGWQYGAPHGSGDWIDGHGTHYEGQFQNGLRSLYSSSVTLVS
jgi:hypothetical protein